MTTMKAGDFDIEAKVTLLGPERGGRTSSVRSGYRPQHRVRPDYLTSGTHEYIDREALPPGETARARIKFITPEAYPGCIAVGDVLEISEGSRLVGWAEVTRIVNGTLARVD
ncbi:MAG: hypothetical protein QM820_09150 [Minicystis sp.]